MNDYKAFKSMIPRQVEVIIMAIGVAAVLAIIAMIGFILINTHGKKKIR